MKRLTKEQQQTLVEIITEQSGINLKLDEFTDRMLMLFEDVPGFEAISASESKRLINQLWRLYGNQCNRNRC
jgi:hypothetical protein